MKHGKKPTREQRKLMMKFKLNCDDWFVVKDEPKTMTLVHKFSKSTTKVLPKGIKNDG